MTGEIARRACFRYQERITRRHFYNQRRVFGIVREQVSEQLARALVMFCPLSLAVPTSVLDMDDFNVPQPAPAHFCENFWVLAVNV